MRTKKSDKIILDYLKYKKMGFDIDDDFDQLTVDQVREYYFSTEPQFKDIDKDFVLYWAYNYGGDDSIDLLKELNLNIECNNHFYGLTTKEQEAHNRDMKFYENAGNEVRGLVDAKVKQFTTKKQWNDFMEWTNTRGLCYFRIYDIFKKKSAKEFLKSIEGKTEIFENDKTSDYVWNMYLCNSKWHTDDREDDRGLKYARDAYYYYSELLEYFN